MEWFDPVILSRLQFAFTVMFHYIYPPLSIGLGVIIVIMEALWLKTNDPVYENMTKFWVKVFALTFALGVATGIVMEFQFGMNWSTYSRFVGDVFGSALAAEGIFAFFLESGFLAVLVFGWDKVSKKMHFFSTLMVSLGSMFSAVWIVVANSWQQTPAGYRLVMRDITSGNEVPIPEGFVATGAVIDQFQVRAEILDFWQLLFNPSSVSRILHVLGGAWLLGGFVVMSICAFYILKGRHLEFARRGFRIALILATFASLFQLFLGHLSAEVVAEHQPAKLAAMEGVFTTEDGKGTAAYLLGWPSESAGKTIGIPVPGLLSFLVHRDFNEPVTGLDRIPRDEWPMVNMTFQNYHIMVALGMLFIAVTLYSCYLWWRGTLFEKRWLMWFYVFGAILPYIANYAGWITAEVGRQPWVVYGLLRTEDGVSSSVSAGEVFASLIMFTLLYSLLFALFIYVLNKKIQHGPDDTTPALRGVHRQEELKAVLSAASSAKTKGKDNTQEASA
ncbi:MAG: cytochrome ubiquinol oxidase subunit I [Sumerlaeia bacterium]